MMDDKKKTTRIRIILAVRRILSIFRQETVKVDNNHKKFLPGPCGAGFPFVALCPAGPMCSTAEGKDWDRPFSLFAGNSSEAMPQHSPIGRYARIIMDDWFKRSFGNNSRKRLLQLFLQELLPERRIVQLEYTNTEYVNPFPGKKSVRIDVECTDADGTRFIVEMQVAPQESFYDRAVFYSTFAIQQQLVAGRKEEGSYSFPPVYFIGLMDFSFHKDTDRVLYRYSLREEVSNELMTSHLQYIFLELPNCRRALTPEASVLDNFCYALHNMEHLADRPAELKEEIFKLLFESAEIATFSPEERIKYENDMTTERDIRNQIAYARKEGMNEGMEKGMMRGMQEGRQEGRDEERQRIIQGLREEGVPEEVIMRATGSWER